MTILRHPQVLELSRCIVDLSLADSRPALLAGIHPGFVDTIPTATSPIAQLISDLTTLSAAGTLVDGSTPLAVWLENALLLAGPRSGTEQLREALSGIKDRGGIGAPQSKPAKMKILFLAAAPWDKARIDLGREVREITHGLRAAPKGESIEIAQEWAVRLRDIQVGLLRHQPDIVHFAGHGSGKGEILVEDEHGAAVSVPAAALGELFSLLPHGVSGVILNACYTEPQAEAIAKHVEWVVGTRRTISDDASAMFSFAFYQALGFGASFKSAYQLGKNQIAINGLKDSEIPVLITRPTPEEV